MTRFSIWFFGLLHDNSGMEDRCFSENNRNAVQMLQVVNPRNNLMGQDLECFKIIIARE